MVDNTRITTLHNLLDLDACRIVNAEIQLKNLLPQLITKADTLQLKTVLQKYMNQVEDHIYEMETFVNEECIQLPIAANRIMTALIDEADEKLAACTDPAVADARLLSCVQSINHYKIYAYGTLAAFADVIGLEKATGSFRRAEMNEKSIDDRLSQLAAFEINKRALTPITLGQKIT
jgi:ferritin-like metal-binding protein YciE